jgi:hypothetical protein
MHVIQMELRLFNLTIKKLTGYILKIGNGKKTTIPQVTTVQYVNFVS